MGMRKKGMAILCVVMMLASFGFTGCGEEPVSPGDDENSKFTVQLYYVNEDYIVTGNGEPMMPPSATEIACKPELVMKAAVASLDGAPKEEHYLTMMKEDYTVNDVYEKDGTAFVDLSSENLSGSSIEEGFLINQIVLTLMDSFDTVKSVQFLVDGEVVESLMGHYDVRQPFTGPLFDSSGQASGGAILDGSASGFGDTVELEYLAA